MDTWISDKPTLWTFEKVKIPSYGHKNILTDRIPTSTPKGKFRSWLRFHVICTTPLLPSLIRGWLRFESTFQRSNRFWSRFSPVLYPRYLFSWTGYRGNCPNSCGTYFSIMEHIRSAAAKEIHVAIQATSSWGPVSHVWIHGMTSSNWKFLWRRKIPNVCCPT